MSDVVTPTCPNCGTTFSTGIAFSNNTIMGTGYKAAFAARCPNCGHTVEMGKEGPGTYSAVGGVVRKVADYIASADPAEVEAIRARAATIQADKNAAEAVALLVSMGWSPPSTVKSRLETANLALDLVAKLVTIIGILLAGGVWTSEHVHALFDQWFR